MKKGYFGDFGGQFVPELLMPPLQELEKAYAEIGSSASFKNELAELLNNYAGRETPITFCPSLSEELGFKLWLKREDLLHTGAHKMNNTLGQALLAKRMGKTALVAETGAGQHGVATAAAAARLGMECLIFMGATDVERQAPNVERMRLLGAKVEAVQSGTKTLKDAINAALRYWIASQANTHYCFGTAAGPHPFPTLVRDFQKIIGLETIKQMQTKAGKMPHTVVACVGGGSNAIGMFYPFASNPNYANVRLVGVEAAGTGKPGCYHSATLNKGEPGVLHGQYSMLLQDENGQIEPSHSLAPGLDYPGVGAEHAHLKKIGRVSYEMINDQQALAAFYKLSLREGIIPALESSHALAYVHKFAPTMSQDKIIICNLSGRGDKDLLTVAKLDGIVIA